MRDLSDRRKAEAAARLAGVGTLAAGVAHEINNPLTFVAANLELAEEAVRSLAERPEDARAVAAEARHALADARAGALRVRDIVRDLKVFSREEEGTGPVDVRRALQAALAIARSELKPRARVRVLLDEPVPPVLANEHRLGQVFLNLLVNAAQAIPPGRAEANEVAVAARAAGGEVVAEVRDTGSGMSPEVRARIFEPFFTTKPLGQGTGLGLSICHGIVAALGGRIEVESVAGQGSTFRVVLPAAASADRTGAPTASPAPAPALRARVLVVDDEPMVGLALSRLLASHDVTVVERAAAAQDLLGRGERFDLVLCDLMMPDMTGMALHAWVAERDPVLAARMLFVTGGAFTEEAQEFLERHADRRLEKPFDVAELRAAVAAVLEGGGTAGRAR
jgi:CheY-like chemotaxis protein